MSIPAGSQRGVSFLEEKAELKGKPEYDNYADLKEKSSTVFDLASAGHSFQCVEELSGRINHTPIENVLW